MAIKQQIHVTLIPRNDNKIFIQTKKINYQADLQNLPDNDFLRFVIATIKAHKSALQTGFELKIDAEFAANLGLGSSAAVSVACVNVLQQFVNNNPTDYKSVSPDAIFKIAYDVVRQVQGTASCADVAASVFGGTLFYKVNPLIIEPLTHTPPITVVYSGAKETTVKVVKKVQTLQQQYPTIIDKLFATIDQCSLLGKQAILQQDWQMLGDICNLQQGVMLTLGVSNQKLSNLLSILKQHPNITGAKISGSGLGDCVIGIGEVDMKSLKNELEIFSDVKVLEVLM